MIAFAETFLKTFLDAPWTVSKGHVAQGGRSGTVLDMTPIPVIGAAHRLHKAQEWERPLCTYVSPVMIPLQHVMCRVLKIR